MRCAVALLLLLAVPPAQAQDAVPTGSAAAMRAQRATEYVNLGERFLASGDRVSAAAYFRDAISADPSIAAAYVALGEVQLARGALRDAEETFRVGMARAMPDARLWTGLVRVLDAAGRASEADAALVEATTHFARDERIMLLRRDRAEARLAWSLALSLTRRLAVLAEERGDDATIREHRMHARALLVLVGEVDPVTASGADASALRRVLSR